MPEAKEQKGIRKDRKILALKNNHYLKCQENKDRLKDPKENRKQCLREADNSIANNNQILLMSQSIRK